MSDKRRQNRDQQDFEGRRNGLLTADFPHRLRYAHEDDHAYHLADDRGRPWIIAKNRGIPEPPLGSGSSPLTAPFRLLIVAAVGLAPAGLGTLVLAPFAAVWSIWLMVTRRLDRADRIRSLIAIVISCLLIGLGLPLVRLFFEHLR